MQVACPDELINGLTPIHRPGVSRSRSRIIEKKRKRDGAIEFTRAELHTGKILALSRSGRIGLERGRCSRKEATEREETWIAIGADFAIIGPRQGSTYLTVPRLP